MVAMKETLHIWNVFFLSFSFEIMLITSNTDPVILSVNQKKVCHWINVFSLGNIDWVDQQNTKVSEKCISNSWTIYFSIILLPTLLWYTWLDFDYHQQKRCSEISQRLHLHGSVLLYCNRKPVTFGSIVRYL